MILKVTPAPEATEVPAQTFAVTNEASFRGWALEAVLAAARRPPSNEDSLTDGSSLGGLRRSFVTRQTPLQIADFRLQIGIGD